MTKGLKALVGVVLVFSLLLSGIGYASLTDTLAVTGSASAEAPEELYISNISGNATVVGTLTAFIQNLTLTASGGEYTAEFEVTFFNNSQIEYMYYGIDQKTTGDGEILVADDRHTSVLQDFAIAVDGTDNEGATISPGEKITKTLTITSAQSTLTDVYNIFLFKPSSEYEGAEKVVDIYGQFENIMNDPETKETLLDTMQNADNAYKGGWGVISSIFYGRSGTEIGNVPGSNDADSALIDTLFTINDPSGALDENGDPKKINLLEIKDEEGNVIGKTVVLIVAQNLDNDTNTGITIENAEMDWKIPPATKPAEGCEITIFMIPDEINNDVASVNAFAMTYATDDKGETWYQVGQLFAGKAETGTYAGLLSDEKNSIKKDTWESTVEYDPDGDNSTNNTVAIGADVGDLFRAYLPFAKAEQATAQAFIVSKKEYL